MTEILPASRLFDLDAFIVDEGHAWRVVLPADLPRGDEDGASHRSALMLFENGVELGPAHAPHDRIRTHGHGLFSHWGRQIWLSTSDNSSPQDNGRRYQVLFPGEMWLPAGAQAGLVNIRRLDLAALDDFRRFQLARQAFREIWPQAALPDMGRAIDADTGFADAFAATGLGWDYSYERKYNLDQLYALIGPVAGDVAECGTHAGASAYFLARRIQAEARGRRLHLFDSFEGLSCPEDIDGSWWRQGDLSATEASLRTTLSQLGDTSFVQIYPGWIPERFPEIADRRFAFVHIDVDLYQATFDSLAFFYPRLSSGGVIVFDDYGYASCPGATAAIDQFLADKPETAVNLSAGGAFLLRR